MTSDLALLAFSALFALAVLGAAPGRRRRRRRPDAAAGLLADASARLRAVPFDRMGPVDRKSLARLLERADAVATTAGGHARANHLLAEMALVAGDREKALERFRLVLCWSPGAPVRRTVEALERRLSPSTPISARIAS